MWLNLEEVMKYSSSPSQCPFQCSDYPSSPPPPHTCTQPTHFTHMHQPTHITHMHPTYTITHMHPTYTHRTHFTHTANMKTAAAVIKLASMSFSSPHTLSQSMRRGHVITRSQVDSTPRQDDPFTESSVIANGNADSTHLTVPDSTHLTVPDSTHLIVPSSPRSVSEVITNAGAIDIPVPGDTGPAHQDHTHKPTSDRLEAGQLVGDDKEVVLFRATFDFEASSDQELMLRSGDLVTVLDKSDSGWWKGECEGRSGWFPETYVEPVITPTEVVPVGVASSPSMWEQEVAGEREGGGGGDG